MTRALRLWSALQGRITLEAKARKRRAILEAREALNRSPLFNLVYNKVSVGFSLLEFAEVLCQLGKPGGEDARNVAERIDSQALFHIEELPDDERPSALFHVRRLRAALDEFRGG
jgi:hypothetical protein